MSIGIILPYGLTRDIGIDNIVVLVNVFKFGTT